MYKTDDIYKDIVEDVETRFDTAHFELDRPLPKRNNKKVIGLMKDELGELIMKEFAGLRAKTYSHLKDDNDKGKKRKCTKKCIKVLYFYHILVLHNHTKIHKLQSYLDLILINLNKQAYSLIFEFSHFYSTS